MMGNIGKWIGPLTLSFLIHLALFWHLEIPKPQALPQRTDSVIAIRLANANEAEKTSRIAEDKDPGPTKPSSPDKPSETKDYKAKEDKAKEDKGTTKLTKKPASKKPLAEQEKKAPAKERAPEDIDVKATDSTASPAEVAKPLPRESDGSNSQPSPLQEGLKGQPEIPSTFSDKPQQPIAVASELDILRSVKPIYPLISRRRGEEGTVIVYVRLSSDGKVEEARIHRSSGFDLLDESALKAVKQWIFKSLEEKEVLVPVVFKLNP
jgi:protein TonB